MEVGAVIGDQYTIVEHIGRGGMADVWSARDARLRRMVAIKTIAVGLAQEVDPVAMFRSEAQTIASMEHPHILPIYDFGEHAGKLYIVMRLVTGGSLENRMNGPMPPSEVLRIGEVIASALDYAHQNKIIHLDLKPPNILMDSGGAPYLADFGLATVLDPEGRARNPGSGTLLYMAPEQLTSEVIDRRADIYSFSMMMFHMLTGKMPFEGMVPLALRQIQYNDELPPLHDTVASLPEGLTQVLRRGTAREAAHRPLTLMSVVEEMRAILLPGGARLGDLRFVDDEERALVDAVSVQTERLLSLGDRDLIEAVDIYTRARYNWAGGQGRFIVSLTHFLIMSSYYQEAARYALPVDRAGYQVLLRGALEYNTDLDIWWAFNSDEDRRWVCLHTLRSGTTPARIRALNRLETLPDDRQNPVIPRLVAQALEIEPETEARLAMLRVLTTRASLLRENNSFQIRSEFMGRLLTTMTRLGIEITPPTVWRDPVYSPEIDLMIAAQAFDAQAPDVAEAAARAVGKMRSLVGVRYFASEQRAKRPGALPALALVRDEVPALPDIVSPQARAYTWLANTLRRLTDRPLDLIVRFLLALLGGWIAFGQHIYSTWFALTLFTPTRWGNAIASGLTMGLFIAIVVMLTDELSTRLRGFWPWWMRLLVAGALGISFGTLTWTALRWFYNNDITPTWDLMRLGGTGLALGFMLVSMTNWARWKALLLPAVLIYIPIVLANINECLQDLGCAYADGTLWLPSFNYFPIAGIGLAIGLLVGWFIPRRRDGEPLVNLPARAKVVLAAAVGALWCALVWWMYIVVYQQDFITYDHISLWFFGSLAFGLLAAALMQRVQTVALAAVALSSFILLTIISTQAVNGALGAVGADHFDPAFYVAPQAELGPHGDRDSLLAYLYPPQLMTVGIPMVLIVALGAYVQSTYATLSTFVGQPQRIHRARDAWLTAVIYYVLFMSGFVSVFALFSIHVNVWYGLAWSLWGFLTFVAALAVWRWAAWGAKALLVLGMLLLVGAFAYDALNTAAVIGEIQHILSLPEAQRPRTLPVTLLDPSVMLAWGMWSLLLAIFVFGVIQRQLWGAIGIVSLIVVWYFVSILGVLPSFGLGQALAHLALVAYVLRPYMTDMEPGRWADSIQRLRTPPREIHPLPPARDPLATASVTLIELPPRPAPPVTLPLAPLASLPPEQEAPPTAAPALKIDTRGLRAPAPPVRDVSAAPDVPKPRLKFDASALSKQPPPTQVKPPLDSDPPSQDPEA